VQLLLKNGAEVNLQGGFFQNALQAASDGGHKAIVQMLLENGAEMDLQGRHAFPVAYSAVAADSEE
jgi:ankyrin repeat protein